MVGQKRFLLLIPLLFFLLSAAVSQAASFPPIQPGPAATAAEQDWLVQLVEGPKTFNHMGSHSLAQDGNGHLHVAYGKYQLYYAHYDGIRWQWEEVDRSSPQLGEYTAIAVDSQSRPHISYYDRTNSALKYAYHDGSGWQTRTVVIDGDVGKHTALGLDTADRPYIAYYDASNADLKLAWYSSKLEGQHRGVGPAPGWQVSTVDSVGDVGQYASLAMYDQTYPHIAYCDTTSGTLKYAYQVDSGWHTEVVDDPSWPVAPSLVMDNGGRPHIAYNSWSSPRYAYHDGSTWQIQTVPYNPYEMNWKNPSLALDTAGHAHIVCSVGSKFGDYYFLYNYYDGVNWQREIVAMDLRNTYPSIIVDANGWPHVSYLDEGGDWLHAYKDSQGWQYKRIDAGGGGTGRGASLALDGQGCAHLSYCEAGHYSLRYTRLDDQGRHLQVAADDSQELFWGSTSLALDTAGRAHIAYYGWLGQDLYYAYYSGTAWLSQTIAGPFAVGRYNDLALDRAGRPHLAYYDETHGSLRYAYYSDTAWFSQTVDAGPAAGVGCSLELDGLDHPHISYQGSNETLRYAHYDGVDWQVQSLDDALFPHTSLALDASGRPHISYARQDAIITSSLRYIHYDGNTWITATVDAGDEISPSSSLALDTAGQPRIAYYDRTGDTLRYAHWDGTYWQIRTIEESVGQIDDVSMAVGSDGRPHVAYYSSSRGWLKYARPDIVRSYHSYLPLLLLWQ